MTDTTLATGAPARAARSTRVEAITVIRAGVLAICLAALAHTSADPDLWGHVRFGHDIVAARAVTRVDSYSFTSDRPWINHEWMAEVLMFAAYGTLGSAGLVLMKLALVAGVLLLAAAQLRRLPEVMARDRFLALAAVAMLTRTFSFRPQVFSLLLFAVLLALLSSAARGRTRMLAGVPPIFALWVNLHGGWLVGLGVLGVWLAFGIVARRATLHQRLALAATGLAACAATLLNPYGVGMWVFLGDTVGLTRADVADWQPMYAMPAPVIVLWLLVVIVGAVTAIRARRSCPARHAAIALLLAGLSFKVNRLDAFLAIAVAMLLAPFLGGVQRARPTAKRPGVGPLSPAGALVLAAGLAVPATYLMVRSIDRIVIGAGFPEAEAAAFVLTNHLHGRMIVWFGWGEYAIWHFAPDIRVSVDGRRETVYAPPTLDANYRFAMAADAAALEYADRSGADLVWMPNDAPVNAALGARGWARIFTGPVSSIYTRTPARSYVWPRRVEPPRVFPGP